MTRRNERNPLTPEESRWLDGALPPEDARRLERELAADPHRRAALEQYRDAMAIWRQDADHGALDGPEALDLDGMTDDILAGAIPMRRAEDAPRHAGAYAAAAILLVAIGLGGTAWVRSARAADRQATPPSFSLMDAGLLEEIATSPDLYLGNRSRPADGTASEGGN